MQQDERELLQEMYEEYLLPLKKFAVKLGANVDDIEDLAHEAIIEYYLRYPLDLPKKAKTVTLIRILKSRCIDGKRKLRREVLGLDNPDEEPSITKALLENGGLVNLLDQEVQDRELYRSVWEIVKKMKKDWRNVIILRVIEERSTEETCEILGISDTVCRSRLSRARKDLRKRLKRARVFED